MRPASRHTLVVSVVSFMCPNTRDEQRLQRCVAVSVSDRGLIPICERACLGALTPFGGGYETGVEQPAST